MKLKKLISLVVVLVAMLSIFAITSISSSAASNTPATPQNLTFSNGFKSATLSWDKVSGATGYKVAILNESGNWETYEITTSTSVNLTLEYVTTYTFSVRAYDKSTGTTYHSGYSNSVSFVTEPLQVETVKVSDINIDSVYLYWSTSKYATGYQVYYAKDGSSSYSRLTSTTDKFITLEDLDPDTDYSFKIRAYYRDDDGNVSYGEFSDMVMNITTTFPAPENITVTVVDGMSAEVSWDAIDGADGYQIYSKGVSDSSFTRYDSTTSTSMTVDFDETTYIEVRAYMKLNGNIFGEFSDTYVVVGMVENFKVTAGVESASFSWSAVDGASGYKIAYLNNDGEWATLGYTSSTSYTYSKLDYLGTYTFSIRAYEKVTTSSTVHSDYSDAITVATDPAQVSSVSYSNLELTSVDLAWTAVEGASGYQVYYAKGSSSSYSRYDSTTATAYSLYDLDENTAYSFKIRAYYRDSDGNVSYGEFTTKTVDITTTLSAVQNLKIADSSNTAEDATKTISWNSVPNATGYQIYIKAEDSSTWSLVETTSSTSATVDLYQNMDVSVKVRAYYQLTSSTKVYGSYSSTSVVTTGMSTIKDFEYVSSTNTATTATLTVQWAATQGVDGYRVYYRENGSSDWSWVTLYGESTSSKTLTSLTPGTEYELTIKAFYKGNGETQWSDSCNYIYKTTSAKSTSISVDSSSIAYIGEATTLNATIKPSQSTTTYTITPQDYTYSFSYKGGLFNLTTYTETVTIPWEDYLTVYNGVIVAKAATVIPYVENDSHTGDEFSFPVLITTDDTGKTATTNLTIKEKDIEITSDSTLAWSYGSVDQLSVSFSSDSSYTEDDVVWTSTDTSIATVDDSGIVTMVGTGYVTILASTSDGKQSASYGKYVFAAVEIGQSYYTNCEIGSKYTLDATLIPANSDDAMVYISSDTSVATVSNGVVSFVGIGSATITICNAGNSSQYEKVVVTSGDAVILPSMTSSEVLDLAYDITDQIKDVMPGFYRTDYSLTSNFNVSNPSDKFTTEVLEGMFTNLIAPSTSFMQTVNSINYPSSSDFNDAQTAYWNAIPISGQQFVMIEGLDVSDFESIEIIDEETSYTYDIVLTLEDETMTSLPTNALSTTHGLMFDILTNEDFAAFNYSQDSISVSFSGISQVYHDSSITITVDKTTGTIVSMVYDMKTDIVIEDFKITNSGISYLNTDLSFTLNGISEYQFFTYTV